MKTASQADTDLEIFDISDIAYPKRVSRITLPKFYMGPSDFWSVRLCRNICLVNDTANGLFVVDVSDVRHPKFLGNLVLPKYNGKINDPVGCAIPGDGVIYICGEHTGLYVAEFAAMSIQYRTFKNIPKIPDNINSDEEGFISSGASPNAPVRAAALVGDFAYAACATDGIKVFKISESSVDLVERFGEGFASDIRERNGILYCAERERGVGVYKISSEGKLKEIGRISSIDNKRKFDEAHYLWAPKNSDIIAVSMCEGLLYFFDTSKPENPVFISSGPGGGKLYGNNAAAELAQGKYFAINTYSGFFTYDFSGKPELINKLTHRSASQTASAAAFGDEFFVPKFNGYAFVNPKNPSDIADWEIMEFPDANAPILKGIPQNSKLSAPLCGKTQKSMMEGIASVDGKNIALSNRMYKSLRVYDFSDKRAPKLLRSYKLKNNPNAASFWNGRLVVPCGYSGLLLETSSAPKH